MQRENLILGGSRMNQEKIGLFIQQLRKEQEKTQRELAGELLISDKTVSKWETGKGIPDMDILLPLCNALGISVNELLSGERLSSTDYSEKAEENMMNLMKENENYKKSSILQTWIGVALGALLAVVFLFSILGNGRLTWFLDLSLLLKLILVCGACVLASGACSKKSIVTVIHKALIPAGALTALSQGIILLHNMADLSSLGPVFSVMVLSLVYSLLLYLIFIPLRERF